jgi:phage repressor protein C with HTH and peptisase S24 domain
MTRGQKGCYFFSVDPETNAYFKERAEAVALARPLMPAEKYDGLQLEVVEVTNEERYITAIPLLNIKAAAGGFSMEQLLEVCDWVRLPEPFEHKPGYFVVQVVGESMNRRIPNGAWCLFKSDQGGSRNGKIVLVESSHIQDAETGSSYTVKRYHSEKVSDDGGGWEHSKIVLSPMSSVGAFEDIELVGDQVESFGVVGEFVAVL